MEQQRKYADKKELYTWARSLGFLDLKGIEVSLHDIRPEVRASLAFVPKTALLLFWGYGPPEGQALPGQIALSNYYPASNAAYQAAREMEKKMKAAGISCLHTQAMQLKRLALRAGGQIGKNSLYYHEKFGSFVVIQAILLEERICYDSPGVRADMCKNCTICADACPVHAVGGDIARLCMRRRMGKNPPEETVRGHIYQLLGCEICQQVCPHNHTVSVRPFLFDVQDVLSRRAIKKIKEIAGANMARTNIVLAQTMVYAANKKLKTVAPLIRELGKDPLLQEISDWALKEMEK